MPESTIIPCNSLSSTAPASIRSRVLRGGALLLFGKVAAQGCAFARGVIVARLVGAQNFGIAATFSLCVYIFDMVGSLSVDKLLVQAADGNDEAFQSVAHAVQALRGLATGLLMVIFAPSVASLFGAPNAAWAFRYLALLPVLRGLSHMDLQRVQRDLNFGRMVLVDIGQQLVPTLLAWPLAAWLRDYSAMLWLVLLQTVFGVGASFVVAERPYRWLWDQQYIKRIFTFGWPLIANTILLFGVYQGDRFLIGTAHKALGSTIYGLKDLGIFSVALSMTLTPMIAFAGICAPLMLPVLARLQSDRITFQKRYNYFAQAISGLSGLFALPIIVGGSWFVLFLYGRQYTLAGTLVGWMAAGQAVRMARFTPSMAAMALGDTVNAMVSNCLRVAALGGTIAIILRGMPLYWIAMFGCVAEIAALAACLLKLSRDHNITVRQSVKSTFILLLSMALAAIAVPLLTHPYSFTRCGLGTSLMCIAVMLTGINLSPLFELAKFPKRAFAA